MKEGDFVRINFVGKIKESGEVFDTTLEDVAKKHNIYDPSYSYRPLPLVVGGGFVLKGVDEALLNMKVGEKKTVIIPPEKGFGKRNPSLIKLIGLNEFKKQNIEPRPGMSVSVNNYTGRIISVAGGRVKVDFNHPLAGKELEYEIEVVEKIEKIEEKVKAIVEYFSKLPPENIKVKVVEKVAEISFDPKVDLRLAAKQTLADSIKKWVEGIEKVKFIDVF